MTDRWWEASYGYEVYPRSFAGGTLAGVRERLDHLEWLGVDVVWVTPFYPSPLRDGGYDVADYTAVDPRFGTLEEFDALVADAHDRGLRVLIDLVPNHTSSDHPWFRAARSGRDDPHRDWYIWRDPAPDGGPPNNWVSVFGGSAWTRDEPSGQYWLHLFLPEQPDLNWDNPAVAEAFDGVLRFWCDRGVDGFRVDVAHGLVKDRALPDLPPAPVPSGGLRRTGASEWDVLDHVHDMHQPEVLEVYRRWRQVVEPHGVVLLGETYVLDVDRLAAYVADDDGLHLVLWFGPFHIDWSAAAVRNTLEPVSTRLHRHVAWMQSSHDHPRAATRYGGGLRGRERALAVATLMAGLPGVPFLYQGEELGLEDGVPVAAVDPIGRDGCRTPIPWDQAAAQREDRASVLHRFRALVRLRREHPALRGTSVTWLPDDGGLLAYRRGELLVAANLAEQPRALAAPGRLLFSTDPDRATLAGTLAPNEAVVVDSAR